MYHDVLPTISLQAAMQDLLNKIAGDNNFSTHDLVSPQSNPKRFKKFLSMLINFYVFSDGQYGKVEEIRNAVEKLVKAKKDFAAKNEELRNKITHFKSKAVEDAMEEEDLNKKNFTGNVIMAATITNNTQQTLTTLLTWTDTVGWQNPSNMDLKKM